MLNFNFNQLYYFYIVATTGSIKDARKILHVTQPTISNQIKKLESDLGYQLFDRQHRHLTLTKKGIDLLEDAEKLFVIAKQIQKGQSPQKQSRTPIRIGAIPSLANSFVHDFTLRLWKSPKVSVSIFQAEINQLREALENGRIDVILSDAPAMKSGKRFKAYNLSRQKIVAVSGPEFRELKKGFPKSLDGQPYVPFSLSSQLQVEIDYFFSVIGVNPDRVGELNDVSLMRLVASKNIGFVILPWLAVREALKRKECFLIGELGNVELNCWMTTTAIGSKNSEIIAAVNHFRKQQK